MVGFGPSSYTKITTAFVLYEFLVGCHMGEASQIDTETNEIRFIKK